MQVFTCKGVCYYALICHQYAKASDYQSIMEPINCMDIYEYTNTKRDCW